MSPGDLGQVLGELPMIKDPKVLVDTSTRDDAVVYRLSDDIALVQSVDVFTPVVDDPFTFGQVAAANALSDIYAMGARPLFAVSIIGFPVDKLPMSDMALILKGGVEKAREAGIEVAGGHSLDDNEPKYGLCVTGLVHPDRVVTNAGAKPGDLLFLTKPLGIGVLTHGLKQGRLGSDGLEAVVRVMTRLNRDAGEAMVEVGVSACTDVTGFGLLGHLTEMLEASGISACLKLSSIPVLPGARDLFAEGVCPGGTRKNLAFFSPLVLWSERVAEVDRLLLADAQTSGGLLIAVPREGAAALRSALAVRGIETRGEIGEIVEGVGARIEIR